MASGRKNNPIGSWLKRRDHFPGIGLSGPQAGFFGATVTGFAVWAVSFALLPAEMVMPVVATLFLVLAAVLAGVAWFNRGMDPAQVTYADAAGALTLIGFFAAATIDPDQLVRLVESRPQD
jgi:hypothetical protein